MAVAGANLYLRNTIFVTPSISVIMAMQYRFNKESASRKPGIMPLKEAIDRMVNSYKLRQQYDESYVSVNWEKIVGPAIANRTSKVYVKNKVLFLQVDSAPLRNELVRAKEKLINFVNQEMNSKLVEDIVFI